MTITLLSLNTFNETFTFFAYKQQQFSLLLSTSAIPWRHEGRREKYYIGIYCTNNNNFILSTSATPWRHERIK